MKWLHLCASDLQPIEEGKEGIVVVRTNDPENPVSVYVHDRQQCRERAHKYPASLHEIMKEFDTEGNPI